MKFYSFLKPARVLSAVFVIIPVSLIFFDIYGFIPASTARYIALTQFIPSLLNFIHSPAIPFSLFVIIILLTLSSGRSYCSILCPLGIFQDTISRIAHLLGIKKVYRYSPPHNLVRYSVLLIATATFSAGGTVLLVWLDPFSIYGRFSSFIVYPVVTWINNFASSLLADFNIYFTHSVDIKYASICIILIITVIITFILLSAMFKGRLYCNTVCPVGTLLGLISTVSFFKLDIDKESCIKCGKCEKTCKSGCIGYNDGHIDFSRCVLCFNCIGICPERSIRFRFSYLKKQNEDKKTTGGENIVSFSDSTKIARRSFLAGIILVPSLLPADPSDRKQRLYIQDRSKQKEYKKRIFASPPGSTSIETFNIRCTACSLCISRCPSSVLQPSVMQYGIHGIMQPFLDFDAGYCNYDCIVCGEACPSGAISRINISDKHIIKTGKSHFIKENCITYTNGTACGACSEHCPTKAIKMIPFKNRLLIPEINQSICIGCGACEHVCPVRPFRAMYVEGSVRHEKAELPKKEENVIIKKENFPF